MSDKLSKQPFLHFKADLSASVVVFLVALPLCLGIAAGSYVPSISAMIAGVLGGILVGVISKSALGVSGPAASLAPLIAGFLIDIPFEYFLVVAILAGVFQLVFSLIKAGVVTDYFPNNVIKGMLAGIGIILFLKQIPHGLGHSADIEGDTRFNQPNGENTFTELWHAIEAPHLGALIVCTISLAILIFWKSKMIEKSKLLNYIPAPLLVVIFGVIYTLITADVPNLSLKGNQLVLFKFPESGESWDIFTLPDFRILYEHFDGRYGPEGERLFSGYKNLKTQWQSVFSMALTISVVGSLETLLSIEAVDRLDPKKRWTPPNRELFAQGIANAFSGFIGGLRITQVVVRSSANVTGGGQTKLSTVIHGVLFVVCILTMGPLLNLIPKACLSAILIMIAYRLTNPKLYGDLWNLGSRQFIPFIVTIVIIVFSGLLEGIIIGLIFAIYFILRDNRNNEPFDIRVKRIKELKIGYYYDIRIDFHEEVTYLSKNIIKQSLLEIPNYSKVLIDTSDAIYLSSEVTEVIEEYIESLEKERNITVEVIGRELILKEIDDQLLSQIV